MTHLLDTNTIDIRSAQRLAHLCDTIERAKDGHAESERFLRHLLREAADGPLEGVVGVAELMRGQLENELTSDRERCY